MHSKWGIIAVLATLAAALLITMAISGCPQPVEEPVIIDDVPPPDLTPPVDEGAVTNEPVEGEAAPPAEPGTDAPPADPAMDAPPADPAMETPPPAPPAGG